MPTQQLHECNNCGHSFHIEHEKCPKCDMYKDEDPDEYNHHLAIEEYLQHTWKQEILQTLISFLVLNQIHHPIKYQTMNYNSLSPEILSGDISRIDTPLIPFHVGDKFLLRLSKWINFRSCIITRVLTNSFEYELVNPSLQTGITKALSYEFFNAYAYTKNGQFYIDGPKNKPKPGKSLSGYIISIPIPELINLLNNSN